MKTLAIVALALSFCLTPAISDSQGRSALSPQDVKQIGEVTQAFTKAVLSKDWKAVAALYVDDAVLYPPGESAVKGRVSIEACLAGFPPMKDFTLRTTAVEGRDDLAYVQGTYTMMIAAPDEAKPIQASGYFLEIRRKTADGRWLIAVHMLNAHE